METAHNTVLVLQHELEFLDHGGYHRPVASRQPLFCMETSADWKPPLFFEDSPSCPKRKYENCIPERDCALMEFVPVEHRKETVPCRHIPLNEKGETIESLSKAGKSKEIEAKLRSWLVTTIEKLEAPVSAR